MRILILGSEAISMYSRVWLPYMRILILGSEAISINLVARLRLTNNGETPEGGAITRLWCSMQESVSSIYPPTPSLG